MCVREIVSERKAYNWHYPLSAESPASRRIAAGVIEAPSPSRVSKFLSLTAVRTDVVITPTGMAQLLIRGARVRGCVCVHVEIKNKRKG